MSVRELGCGFKIIDHKMILQYSSERFRKFYSLIDFASFEIVAHDADRTIYFRDKDHLYVESYMCPFAILPDAKPQDFKIVDIEKGLISSGAQNYYFAEKLTYDFDDLKPLEGLYYRVKDQVYFSFDKPMREADLDSFQVFTQLKHTNLAKDKHHLYFRDQIVEDVDVSSFELLTACFDSGYYLEQDHTYYATDRNFAYYIDTIAKQVKVIKTKSLDAFHFKVIDKRGYAFDREYRYDFGRRTSLKKLQQMAIQNNSGK